MTVMPDHYSYDDGDDRCTLRDSDATLSKEKETKKNTNKQSKRAENVMRKREKKKPPCPGE